MLARYCHARCANATTRHRPPVPRDGVHVPPPTPSNERAPCLVRCLRKNSCHDAKMSRVYQTRHMKRLARIEGHAVGVRQAE